MQGFAKSFADSLVSNRYVSKPIHFGLQKYHALRREETQRVLHGPTRQQNIVGRGVTPFIYKRQPTRRMQTRAGGRSQINVRPR